MSTVLDMGTFFIAYEVFQRLLYITMPLEGTLSFVNEYKSDAFTGWEHLRLVVEVEIDNVGRFGEHCIPNPLNIETPLHIA